MSILLVGDPKSGCGTVASGGSRPSRVSNRGRKEFVWVKGWDERAENNLRSMTKPLLFRNASVVPDDMYRP